MLKPSLRSPFVVKTLRLLKFARPHWKMYVVTTLISAAGTFVGLVQPWLFKMLIDDVLINKRFELFFIIIAASIGAWFGQHLFNLAQTSVGMKMSQRMQTSIRTQLYRRIEDQDITWFQKKSIGDLTSRLESDIGSVQSHISLVISDIPNMALNLALTIGLALTLNVNVTIFALMLFPIYMFTSNHWLPRMKRVILAMRDRGVSVADYLRETLTSMKLIKIFTREEETAEGYKRRLDEQNATSYRSNIYMSLVGMVTGFVGYMPNFVVLAYGGWQVLLGVMTVGSLVALQSYIMRLWGPLSALADLNKTVQMNMLGVDRLFEILDSTPKIIDVPDAISLPKLKGAIEFKDVWFGYEPQRPIIKGIIASIKPGSHVGLVGPTGVGKSTLANLLFRFFDPDRGQIMLDGNDLRSVKVASLRSKIGYVSQDAMMFNTSIDDNIRLGKPDATVDEIVRAAKLAHIHDTIAAMPNGYQTIVGERGCRLSGGEQQRIAIARVILRNPDIVILDEPTSSLDSESESKIQDAISYITQGKTTLTIAHRLSTLKNVDQIWVLNDGQLAERGTFDELIEKKGKFHQYYTTQFGGYEVFLQKLDVEMKRSRRYKKPLSLVAIAADGIELDGSAADPLKVGELLSQVSMSLASSIEDIDFSADYPAKPGTWIVAMPEADEREAARAAKLIAKSLGEKHSHKFTQSVCKMIQKDVRPRDLIERTLIGLKD